MPASTFAMALRDKLGERVEARFCVRRERRSDGRRRDSAPESTIDDDRRSHRRAHPELAQLGGIVARHAFVRIHARGCSGLLHLRKRCGSSDGDLPAAGEVADAGRAPFGEHSGKTVAVVTRRQRGVPAEMTCDLARDERQHLLGLVLARDGRGDAS